MSNYYKLRIQDLETSRLKLISDVTELRAENERLQKQLKRMKAKALRAAKEPHPSDKASPGQRLSRLDA